MIFGCEAEVKRVIRFQAFEMKDWDGARGAYVWGLNAAKWKRARIALDPDWRCPYRGFGYSGIEQL
jgi:hypothetical protein